MEMGSLFIVASKRLEKRRIEPGILGLEESMSALLKCVNKASAFYFKLFKRIKRKFSFHI